MYINPSLIFPLAQTQREQIQYLWTFPEYVTEVTMCHVEPSQAVFRQDQGSDGYDLGSWNLFRQYCRDKEMLKDDDPFLLIRGGF